MSDVFSLFEHLKRRRPDHVAEAELDVGSVQSGWGEVITTRLVVADRPPTDRELLERIDEKLEDILVRAVVDEYRRMYERLTGQPWPGRVA